MTAKSVWFFLFLFVGDINWLLNNFVIFIFQYLLVKYCNTVLFAHKIIVLNSFSLFFFLFHLLLFFCFLVTWCSFLIYNIWSFCIWFIFTFWCTFFIFISLLLCWRWLHNWLWFGSRVDLLFLRWSLFGDNVNACIHFNYWVLLFSLVCICWWKFFLYLLGQKVFSHWIVFAFCNVWIGNGSNLPVHIAIEDTMLAFRFPLQ